MNAPQTGLWAEQHGCYTRFLSIPGWKESNVPKPNSSLELTVLIYILCIKVDEMFLVENTDEIEFQDFL